MWVKCVSDQYNALEITNNNWIAEQATEYQCNEIGSEEKQPKITDIQ